MSSHYFLVSIDSSALLCILHNISGMFLANKTQVSHYLHDLEFFT